MQQRQVDVAADYRDVVCNRVLSGGGGRDRPFGGFDGAVRPARGDQSPEAHRLRRPVRGRPETQPEGEHVLVLDDT